MLVAVVGAQRNRVLKVVSLLQQQQQQQQQISKERIEYLPCVAIFGTYQNEDTNETISYLERFVWFHGEKNSADFSNFKPQSLAVIFDKDDDNDNDNDSHSGSCKKDNRPRIPIVAIGCGLDEQNPSTLEQIKNFLITLSGSNHDETAHKTEKDDVLIRCIQPASPPYSSMKEETAVYRAMTAEEKEEVSTRQQKMGPGKMVKFVHHLIHEYHQPDHHNINKTVTTAATKQQQQGETNEEIGSFNDQIKNEGSQQIENEREEQPPLPDVVVEIDLKKPRYACRICREILFGQDDLEDPPHTRQRHSFGYSKVKNFKGLQQQQFKCQSYFLHSPLHWMVMKNTNDHGGEHNGEIESCDYGGTNEGKIICFNCRCKLGQWNWSGAQCSCGTWVVPAIQINCSKVDLIAPEENSLPQQQQQQSYDDQHNFHPLSDSVLQQQQSNTAIMMEPVLPRWS